MKILKHGKANKVITCNCCCVFEFDMQDVKYETSITSCCVGVECEKYIICPDCGAKIRIVTPISPQAYKIRQEEEL